MPVATDKPKRTRGRPPRDQGKKTDRQFHLVLLEEEMDLFVIAADLANASSTGAFLREAVREFDKNPNLVSQVPQELLPKAKETTKHCPLLLSSGDMEKVHAVGTKNYSAYIRTAGLAACFSKPVRNEAFEAAVEALKNRKATDSRREIRIP